MQNTMLLDSLFASAKGSSLNAPGNSSSYPSNSISDRGTSVSGYDPPSKDSFFSLLAERVNKLENTNNNQIQDNTVQANKAEQNQVPPQTQQKTAMTEAEAYEMVKKVEDLAKEAEDIIAYICNLLGINVEQANQVIIDLLQDSELISGELAGLLDRAMDAGADNALLVKMQNLVSLLQKTADYVATAGGDPKEAIFNALLEKDITVKQNEFKGFTNQPDSETQSLIDIAKVVGMLEKAAEGIPVLANTSESQADTPVQTTDGSGATNAESLLGVDSIAASDTQSGTGESFSADTGTSDTTPDKNLADAGSGDETAQMALSAPNGPLAEIGVKTGADDTKTTSGINLSEEVGGTTDAAPSDKNNIVDSMKVNVLNNNETVEFESVLANDETAKEVKINSDVPAALGTSTKTGAESPNTFLNVLDIQTSPIIDRAQKIDIIAQIMDKAQSALKDGQNMLKIQLHPARLGEVFMKISVEEGRVVAKVVTESLIAKEAIETSLYQLKESLGTQGIKIDKFNVFVGDKWQAQSGQSGFAFQQGKSGKKGYQAQSGVDGLTMPELSANSPPVGIWPNDTGQLDLIA